jgi:hypothetical protein
MKLDRLYYFSLFLGFILGVRGGFIALWPEDQPEKAKIFPYSAASLPEPDKEALEKGIYIDTEEELVSILEDFLS